MCLDAIVTICDASNILRQLTEERERGAINEAQEQIAYADIILCNKVQALITDSSYQHADRGPRQTLSIRWTCTSVSLHWLIGFLWLIAGAPDR